MELLLKMPQSFQSLGFIKTIAILDTEFQIHGRNWTIVFDYHMKINKGKPHENGVRRPKRGSSHKAPLHVYHRKNCQIQTLRRITSRTDSLVTGPDWNRYLVDP